VLVEWQKTLFLRDTKDIATKGWLLDVMNCIDKIGFKEFSLSDVYRFENELAKKHPGNHHIKDKIRQQLQFLGDKKYLKFTSRGKYQVR
jgi:type II restriction enzyme